VKRVSGILNEIVSCGFVGIN